MDIQNNELSQEELSKVSGGASYEYYENGEIGGVSLSYSDEYPYYLKPKNLSLEYCDGFSMRVPTSERACERCKYEMNGFCRRRTRDNDPFA